MSPAIPLKGDRSAWDVDNYPARHASDLDASAPVHHVPSGNTNGDYVVWNSYSGCWVATAPTPPASSLDDLDDVSATSPDDGDILQYDSYSGAWVAATPFNLDSLGDVNAPAPDDGDVLVYDSYTGTWLPETGAGVVETDPIVGAINGVVKADGAGNISALAQVSSGERTAGTETALRAFSPEDVAVMAGIHGGGGTPPLFSSIAVIREEQASGTNGGTFTSGSYRTRVLNTEHYDPDGIVTISSNQFTPVAGDYYIVASAPGYQSGQHKAKLYNVTGAADVIIGTSEQSGGTNYNQTCSLVIGKFTANGTDAYEIQHRCTSSTTSTGFGYPSTFGDVEVYASVTLLKLA